MKKSISLLAFAAIMAAVSGKVASAADLAPPPPPPAPEIRPSVADWTGPYIGAVMGGVCMDTEWTMYQDLGNNGSIDNTFNDLPMNGCGFSGGLMAGFNFQIDQILLGLEGDWTWGGKTGKYADPTSGVIERDQYKIRWQASLRARLGMLTTDKTLFYLTGGVGWLRGKLEETEPIVVEDENTHFGYVLGGGVEHALTENLHLRAEYLYSSYNEKHYGTFVGGGDAADVDMDLKHIHNFRLGVSWNFPVSTW